MGAQCSLKIMKWFLGPTVSLLRHVLAIPSPCYILWTRPRKPFFPCGFGSFTFFSISTQRDPVQTTLLSDTFWGHKLYMENQRNLHPFCFDCWKMVERL